MKAWHRIPRLSSGAEGMPPDTEAADALRLGIGANRRDRVYPDSADPARFGARAETGLADPARGPYWTLRFSVPFGWLRELYPAFRPAPGVRMRGNFYKCVDETPAPHYRSWSLVTSPSPDFRRSSDLGELVLA